MRVMTLGFLAAVMASLCVPGCGGDSAPSGGGSPVAASHSGDDAGEAATAAVTALIAGLQQGRPEAFWAFLPSDFQDDLNALIHDFAGRMDGEIWDRSVALLRKLAHVVKQQERFIPTGSPAAAPALGRAQGAGAAPAAADWAKLADMLETLLDSDLASLERLKKADAGDLLATAGGKVFEQLKILSRKSPDDDFAYQIDRLAELRVAVVTASGDQAKLKFEAPGDTPLIVKFVRHKGKWIPEDLESEWLHRMGTARAWLSSALLPETIAESKPRYLTMLNAADAALDRMAAAKTDQEFFVAGQQTTVMLLSLMVTFSQPQQPAEPDREEPPQVETKDLVTVIVAGTLNDDAQDALAGRIKAVVDNPDRATAELAGDDETSAFRVGPVGDLAAFARRLDFLEVTGVEEKSRTILARPRK